MQLLLIIFAALAPVAAILWYIHRKDSLQPEPPKWLMKAFGYGVASLFVALVLSHAIDALPGLDDDAHAGVFEAFADAFLLAAIPEEAAKLLMLWLLLRGKPYYDELFDGIVYAVFVGRGFAGEENITCLFWRGPRGRHRRCTGTATGDAQGRHRRRTGTAQAMHGERRPLKGAIYAWPGVSERSERNPRWMVTRGRDPRRGPSMPHALRPFMSVIHGHGTRKHRTPRGRNAVPGDCMAWLQSVCACASAGLFERE